MTDPDYTSIVLTKEEEEAAIYEGKKKKYFASRPDKLKDPDEKPKK